MTFFRIIIVFIAVIFIACNDESRLAPTAPAKAYALIIATSEIDTAAIHEKYFSDEASLSYGSLAFVPKDISNIKFILAKSGFPVANITNLSGRKILKAEVLAALESIKGEAQPNDLVVVYFTGHGDQIVDNNNDEPDNLDEAFVLGDDLLIDDEINFSLNNFASGVRQILLIDACHSGSGFQLAKESKRKELIQQTTPKFEDEFSGPPEAPRSNTCIVNGALPATGNMQLVYFGACADNQEAKATVQGSFFTTAIASVFNTPSSDWKRHNYQTFYCLLYQKVLSSDREQNVHYQEVGTTVFSKNDYPFKIK